MDFSDAQRRYLRLRRPPAKEKAAPSVAPTEPPGAGQLFNMYVEREDDEIKPDNWYPKWLFYLETPPKTYGELVLTFVHGMGIENAQLREYRRCLRQHRKLVTQINNILLKRSKRRPGLRMPALDGLGASPAGAGGG